MRNVAASTNISVKKAVEYAMLAGANVCGAPMWAITCKVGHQDRDRLGGEMSEGADTRVTPIPLC